MKKLRNYTFILALMGITLVLSACNEQPTEDTVEDMEEVEDVQEDVVTPTDEDLLPSFVVWQAEQLFLVEPTVAEPMNHSESEELNDTFLSTESPTNMEEDGKNPIFYSFEGDTLKTGHLIMSDEVSGSPEEGQVAFGSDDMEYRIEDHAISAVTFEDDIYIIETDNEEYTLTVESDTELTDQYGNRFTIFDTTFSELFGEFSES